MFYRGYELGFCDQTAGIHTPALPHPKSVTSGTILNISGSWFPQLQNED